MRYQLIAPALALVIAFLQHPTATAGQVVIADPVARILPTNQSLHEWCGAGRFEACTLFVGFRLAAACATDGSAMRMTVTARVTPWILLRDLSKAAHEHEHIRDVRAALAKYVDALESTRYASAEDCRAAGLTATNNFGETVRSFARDSTARMHEPAR